MYSKLDCEFWALPLLATAAGIVVCPIEVLGIVLEYTLFTAEGKLLAPVLGHGGTVAAYTFNTPINVIEPIRPTIAPFVI